MIWKASQQVISWLERQCGQLGLSLLQASVIIAIVENPAISQSRLALQLSTGKGTISKVVRQLAETGYIQRNKKRGDSRVHILCPTWKAYYTYQELYRLQEETIAFLLHNIPKDRHEDIEAFLTQIMDNVGYLLTQEFVPKPPYRKNNVPDDPGEITSEQWEAMKTIDIRAIDKNELVDIATIEIDDTLPVADRVKSYLQQVKNPYCVRVGDMAAKLNYNEHGPTLDEIFRHLFREQVAGIGCCGDEYAD